MRFIKRINDVIAKALKVITITCFVFITLLVSANIFVRFFPVASLHWFDEIVELLYAYLVFYGAAALWMSREHFGVGDWIETRIRNPRTRSAYRMIIQVLVLFFVVIFFYYSLRLTLLAQDVTNVFAIPKRVLYSCLPISGMLMIAYSLRNIAVEIPGILRSGQAPGPDGDGQIQK
jgi:TRAP-type transport system small permease protein